MKPRTAWRLCVVAGAVAFACSWAFGKIPGLIACGTFDGAGSYGPILAFELARTPVDIAALFGNGGCRASLVDAQTKGLWLDGLAFIPSYTAFLVLGAVATSSGWWRRAMIAILLIAGLADEVEGIALWRILADLPGFQGQLDTLWWAVHIKFGLLTLGTTLIGLALVRLSRLLPMLVGTIIAIGGTAAIYGFFHLPSAAMMAGLTYAWFALLATALIASVVHDLFAQDA